MMRSPAPRPRSRAQTASQPQRYKRGFALIDALIAVTVLGLGLTSVAALNGRLVANANLAKNRAQAAALAQQKLEELRTNLVNDPDAEIDRNFSTARSGSDRCSASTYACGSGGFARSWTVNAQGAIPHANQVSVTVSWNDAKDGRQDLTLSSLIAWDDPVMQALATTDSDFSGVSRLRPPTGGGETHWSDPTAGLTDQPIVEQNAEFGLTVVKSGPGVAVYDADAGTQLWMSALLGVIKLSGTIRLSSDDPPKQFTNDPAESKGAYFYDSDVTDDSHQGLRVVAAEAGICREKLNTNDTEDPSDDSLDFVCYVGRNWYGRIGVMAIDRSGQLVHIHDHDKSKPDRLCPFTYHYPSSCALTGQFRLDDQIYCADHDWRDDFTAIDRDVAVGITGEPLLLGTLENQHFVFQAGSSSCDGEPKVNEPPKGSEKDKEPAKGKDSDDRQNDKKPLTNRASHAPPAAAPGTAINA